MIPYVETASKGADYTIQPLHDAVLCVVRESINREYELRLRYPVTSNFSALIKLGNIIFARVAKDAEDATDFRTQPFRIYRIGKPINKVVDVYAEHISYDLATFPANIVGRYEYPADVITALKNTSPSKEFLSLWSLSVDEANNTKFATPLVIEKPTTVRDILLGPENSIVKNGAFEIEFGYNTISVVLSRGRGLSNQPIQYGVNMTDFHQDETFEGCLYSDLFPYAVIENDAGDEIVTLAPNSPIVSDGGVMPVTNSVFERRVKVVDLTQLLKDNELDITPYNLKLAADKYVEANSQLFTMFAKNIVVSFVDLKSTQEYSSYNQLDDIGIGDEIVVSHDAYGVREKVRCVATTFDVLSERYLSIEVGYKSKQITDTIADLVIKAEG